MYKIGICDDEISTCEQLEEILHHCSEFLQIKMQIEVWYSGDKLCHYLEQGNHIDFLFLDIELPKLTGIEVGNFIRNDLDNINTQIIFISSKQHYAMQLFDIQPMNFLIKPLQQEEIEKIIRKGVKNLETKNDYFEYKKGSAILRKSYDKIIYFNSERKKIKIITTELEDEFYGKMKEIEKRVPSNFLTIHQSYIINIDYVKEYTYEVIKMMNSDILSVSKLHQKAVKRQLMLLLGEHNE